MAKQRKTSFETSAKWYDDVVGEKGHYYHEKVILPNLLKIMELENIPLPKVLDLACGQGILSRELPQKSAYLGVDGSSSLIQSAKNRSKNSNHRFKVQDLTNKMDLGEYDFTHAVILLALQNIENPLQVLKNAAKHLKKDRKLFIVMNHPCFRIPRQSHWGIDEAKKLQYRRMDSYLSFQKIPIQTHPGQMDQKQTLKQTWSFHHPLSAYSKWLKEVGFSIQEMEEWISDKVSTGSKAKMENRARKEFPLFLTIVANKLF